MAVKDGVSPQSPDSSRRLTARSQASCGVGPCAPTQKCAHFEICPRIVKIATTTTPQPLTTNVASDMKPTPMRTIERGLWSGEEHDRFLEGLKLFPRGPWKQIAAHVGTRSPRQVQTHAQKYYEKVGRRLRGLRKDRKKLVRPEHRLDEDMVQLCQLAKTSKTPSGSGTGVNPVLAERLRAPLSPQSKIGASQLADKTHKPAKSFQEELQDAQDGAKLDLKLQLELKEMPLDVTWVAPPSPCPSSVCESVSSFCGSASSTDAESAMDLSDLDDSCLDFLMEVLGEGEVVSGPDPDPWGWF